jgi:hypothetical protein
LGRFVRFVVTFTPPEADALLARVPNPKRKLASLG